jgi:VCBS repeat-containing protein
MDRRLPVGVVTLVIAIACGLCPAIASAESISGHVIGPSSENLEGICVVAHDLADPTIPGGVRGSAATDAAGNYTITLPAGANSYKVSFRTGGALGCGTSTTPVVTEYYDNETTFGTADSVPVSAGGATIGINAQLALAASGGTITGRVTNTLANGLPDVCASAFDNSNAVVGFDTSDANGDYAITGLPTGSYRVEFFTEFPCGASSTRTFTEYYNNQSTLAAANAFNVVAGSTTGGIDAVLNSKPTANDDVVPGPDEDTDAVTYHVLVNDTDIDFGDAIEIESVTDPVHGTASIVQGFPDDILYDADAGYCGPDSFSYTVDGGDTASVSLDVNCSPVAVNDTATVAEDSGANTIDVRANDTDTDGGNKLVFSKTNGAHGTVSITNAGANVSYTPSANYCGPDSFTYTLNGGSTATVSVTVTCVNDSPVAENDAQTLAEDSGANTIDVLANDTDVDGGPKTVESTTNGAHGAVAITNGGNDVSYTPDANYCNFLPGGTIDQFSYTLNGGSTGFVNVTVTCVDDAPVAVNDSPTVPEDSGASTIDVRANDTDVDDGPKTVASKTNGTHGVVAITNGGNDVSYTPDANYCGPDSFTYTLNGGSTATVSVTVTCADDAPVAANDSATVAEDAGPTAVDVLANDTDADGGPKSVDSTTNGAHGAVAVTNSGAGLSYAPEANFCGTDSFGYTLNGGSSATVSVTVTCGDDVPVAENDAKTVLEKASATTIDVRANDTDADGGPKQIASTTDPLHGTVAITNGGADLTYRPDANFCGADTFTYVLNGGASAAVNITVTCVAPETTITRAPKAVLTITGERVRVRFRFRSNEAGSTFRCKLDRGQFRSCSSPKGYRLKPGRHTFRVVATDTAGNADPTPAKKRVRVVRA